MTKFWQADPNHYANWGERGSLPVDPRTIHDVHDGAAFVSTDKYTVVYGGATGNLPINATEQQKFRSNITAIPFGFSYVVSGGSFVVSGGSSVITLS